MHRAIAPIFADKLKRGDEIRVIAPSRSMAIINDETRKIAMENFSELGLKVTFGKHVEACDIFVSSSVDQRVEDLHDAFRDPNVKGIFTVIGGYNSNQLLDSLDFDLIRDNPKVFCGYSDITALSNAIHAATGLVTYSGPHFSTMGMKRGLEFTLDYFRKCLMASESYLIECAATWSDDLWFLDQDNRTFISNEGAKVFREGSARGRIVGGNLCTLNLLQGTRYMPSLDGALLFIEDDALSSPEAFDRNLQSLIHQPDFIGVTGLVLGRFQRESKMDGEKLRQILSTKKALHKMPVVYDFDFGHTTPHLTFPVGGTASLASAGEDVKLFIETH